MEIKFKDKQLREFCEKKAVAVKKLGDICARKLQTRLADIAAASRVTDLVAGKPHPLTGDRHGQFVHWIWQAVGAWSLCLRMNPYRVGTTHPSTGLQ